MSDKLLKQDILFFQRILAASGLYDGPLDGRWSPAVDEAEFAFEAAFQHFRTHIGGFDPRTESNIATLILPAQQKAREFMNAAAEFRLTVRILSGTRTYAEQDAIYAKGRTIPPIGRTVTNAKGGQSNHNFGIAWDVGIFDGGNYYDGRGSKAEQRREEAAYVELGHMIVDRTAGLEWGGNWTSFVDRPHYGLATGKSTKQVRPLFEKGERYF